jgi:hypothetical protein
MRSLATLVLAGGLLGLFTLNKSEEIDVRRLMINGSPVNNTATAPYVVSLMQCVIQKGAYYCGKFCSGSLVAADVVLTAGHCTQNANAPYGVSSTPRPVDQLYILVGTTNLYSGTATIYKIKSVQNLGYSQNARYPFDKDVGLAFLNSCVKIVPGVVELIKVATSSSEPDWNSSNCSGRTVKTFGFGIKSNLPSQIATDDGVLRYVQLARKRLSTSPSH